MDMDEWVAEKVRRAEAYRKLVGLTEAANGLAAMQEAVGLRTGDAELLSRAKSLRERIKNLTAGTVTRKGEGYVKTNTV